MQGRGPVILTPYALPLGVLGRFGACRMHMFTAKTGPAHCARRKWTTLFTVTAGRTAAPAMTDTAAASAGKSTEAEASSGREAVNAEEPMAKRQRTAGPSSTADRPIGAVEDVQQAPPAAYHLLRFNGIPERANECGLYYWSPL